MKLKHWPWILLLAAGCRPATSVVSPAASPCRVPADSQLWRDTLRISFSERENEAGRLLLRLSARTLIRVDCEGRVQPGLARSWQRDGSGTVWAFTLDSTVQPGSVITQWDLRRSGGVWPWKHILEVQASGTRLLTVRLDTVFAELPVEFAQTDFSVVSATPSGSMLAAISIHPSTFDERDLLDASPGSDLLITRRLAVIGYARSKPGFSDVPLPWDRTYVTIATTSPTDTGSRGEGFHESLAREVVAADARPARGPFWWETKPCPGTTPLRPMGRSPQVVYEAGDESGRAIAERIVALERSSLQVAGLPRSDFLASLAGGEASIYVMSLARNAPLSCSVVPAWPQAAMVNALVDVRAHALIRSGLPAMLIESDGTVHFERPVIVLLPLSPGQ